MSTPHKGQYYIDLAEKNGLEVENGRGDHKKVKAPAGRGYMTVPCNRHPLAKGTECSIKKWFRQLGIVVAVLGGFVLLFVITNTPVLAGALK